MYDVCRFGTFKAIRLVLTGSAQSANDKPQPRMAGARVEFKSPAGVTRPAESTRMAQEMGVEVRHLVQYRLICYGLGGCYCTEDVRCMLLFHW